MPQLSSQDVSLAMASLQEAEGQSETSLLRPEQIEEINSIFREKDASTKARRLSAAMERLVAEASAGNERLRGVLQGFGVEAGMARRFLSGERMPADARRSVQDSLHKFQQEIVDAATTEARHAVGSGNAPAAGPRLNRMRV